jgi:DNA sulfur modification protein DndD
MKFERIELLNFASYYGEHLIDLACAKDKPVIIFLGGTGYGKTSLFDAINWALYGTDYENDLPRLRRGRSIIDYVNESALREAEVNNRFVEMSCTLYFEHDGTHYYITQSLSAKPVRHKDGALQAMPTDRITA